MTDFNFAQIFEAVADALPDRECIVFRGRRHTYAQISERTNRFANFLVDHGVTYRHDRDPNRPLESGQDHVAIYAYNGNEFLETTVGCAKARAVAINVNYRYVAAELTYLFGDSRPRGIVIGSTFAPVLEPLLPTLPELAFIVQIDDGSGNPLLPGAIDYEDALRSASPEPPPTDPSPEDLYITYTGGTTGMPKGVMWRWGDFFRIGLGGAENRVINDFESLDEIVGRARRLCEGAVLASAPFMHGGGSWVALRGLQAGRKVIVQDKVESYDAADIWSCVERERVSTMLALGDSVARPLVDELDRRSYDTSSVREIILGSSVTSAPIKAQLIERIPQVELIDPAGASETGPQLISISTRDSFGLPGTFAPSTPYCRVLDDDRTELLEPGDPRAGWFAAAGPLPIGYLGDPEKTARTFIELNGERLCVPGDRVRLLADGSIELLGRDAVTINSGAEKIHAEEVEQALATHPAIYDVVVCGRPSDRWGEEVVALISLRPDTDPTDDELLARAATQIARFKLPKAVIRLDEIKRSAVGKADYRWARETAIAATRPKEHI